MMRKVQLTVAAAAVVLLATACGGGGDGDDQRAPAPGARSCSAWVGQMDESERWSAAEELLLNAKAADGTEGDVTPSTSTVRQFAVDVGALCEQKASDELLAAVADELYASGAYIL
ncbi:MULTISPECIES: hypothetical protein [Streptomyces]|uniref:Lipoprotein n=1 Tax=Streptomyces lienomycini TaxID=284035 RepID=A0ABV9X3X3_9ACTN|nr:MULTISPECIES: hypothetical protein [Streptomyces]